MVYMYFGWYIVFCIKLLNVFWAHVRITIELGKMKIFQLLRTPLRTYGRKWAHLVNPWYSHLIASESWKHCSISLYILFYIENAYNLHFAHNIRFSFDGWSIYYLNSIPFLEYINLSLFTLSIDCIYSTNWLPHI